jgi:hypothetical protein
MIPGQIATVAIWLSGQETVEQIKDYKEKQIPKMLDIASYEYGVILGDVSFEEKLPTDDRVPEVPDHIHGINVRLLVAEAEVLRYSSPKAIPKRWMDDLDAVDLAYLRGITRRTSGRKLSDAECDEVIEQIGPRAAENALREAIKSDRRREE